MSKKESILTQQSRIVGNTPENVEGAIAQEVAAQISLPVDGGWGWMVVFSAFTSIFILDGVCFTFGSIHNDVSRDLQSSASLVALINSTAVSLYFLASPMASAFINRYGFRECAMCGSIICAFSLCTSYFVNTYAVLFLFYGLAAGFGYSLINMSAGLVVGFYFEKLRSVALAIATCGSSLGVTAMFPFNTFLVGLGGWRPVTLIHSGMFGLIFFLGMAYRPLVSVTVTNTEEATRTLAYLPSVMSVDFKRTTSANKLAPSKTERLFTAVSNANFPTAAAVVDKSSIQIQLPGPSKVASGSNRITLTANPPDGGYSTAQLKQVQSILSRVSDKRDPSLILTIAPSKPKKEGFMRRLFHWEPHPPQSRPLYRDDAFYEGKISNLPAYQRSLAATGTNPSGIEYQMAVTRAAAVDDLAEHRGIFTTAFRRVLATIMDVSLLKRGSFLLMCCSGFFTYLGFLVPYVYLKDRNLQAGIDPKHCTLFISVIGLSNALGRLILGSLAGKVDPLKLFAFWCSLAGVSTIVSSLSYNLYYQYIYCCVFGFSISSVACLRSLILVSLYGLDKLTNSTGMMLIFLGLGNLGSTPLAGVIIDNFGYKVAFYVSGAFITISGLVLIPVNRLASREVKTLDIKRQMTTTAK